MDGKGPGALRPGWISAILMAALLFPAGNVSPSGSGSYPPPGSGDWVITNDTRVDNETIYLGGNLTVVNSNLSLDNATIIGNVTGETLFIVIGTNSSFVARNCIFRTGTSDSTLMKLGGNASLQNCSLLKDGIDGYHVEIGSNITMTDCLVEGTLNVNRTLAPKLDGTVVANAWHGVCHARGVNISNLTIRDCIWGVYGDHNSVVSGCTFERCDLGILLSAYDAVRNCTFRNCSAGILATTGAGISSDNNISGCRFWNCSMGISIAQRSSIMDCSFELCNRSIEALEGDVKVVDSNVSGGDTDIAIRAGHTNATNTTFSPDRAEVDQDAELEVRWNVGVTVLYENETPARNASLQITDLQNHSFQGYTGSDGRIPAKVLKEYLRKHDGAITYSPYRFNASKDSLACNLSVNVNRSIDLKMVLGDFSPPSITITSPADGSLLNRSMVTVNGSASDETGSVLVRIRVDSGEWAVANGTDNWSFPLDITDGRHILEAEALDDASNSARAFVTVTIDTVPPSITIMSPKQGMLVNTTSIEITGLTEPGAALWVDGDVVPVSLGAFRTNKQLREGPNLILLVARDAAGNSATAELRLICDTIPPPLTVSSPIDGAITNKSRITVSGTAETGADIYCEGTLMAGAHPFFNFNATIREGLNNISITAEDSAGNQNIVHIHLTVDTIPPFLEVDLVNHTVTNATTILVTGQTETGSGLSINGFAMELGTNGSFRVNISLHIGTNNISIVAQDAAGNTATVARTVLNEAPDNTRPDGSKGAGGSSWKPEWTLAAIIVALAIIIIILAIRPDRGIGAPPDKRNEGGP